MKNISYFLTSILIFLSSMVFAQKEYPELDVDYSAPITTYDEDGQTVYTYHLENKSSEVIAFYNFKLIDESDDYYITQSLCQDAVVLKPYEEAVYFQCKGSTYPRANWSHKFLRYDDDNSSYPVKDKDYFFHYTKTIDGEYVKYTYHLKNLSDKDLKIYNFSLSDDVDFFVTKSLPLSSEILAPNEDLVVVGFMMSSDVDAPALNWTADWETPEEEDLGNPDLVTKNFEFCEGVMYLLDAAKNDFRDVMGAKQDSWLFDEYVSGVHIEGVNNEVIEDLMFFFDYSGNIGYSGTMPEVENRFYEYKQKLSACLPSEFDVETITKEDDDTVILQAKFSATWKGDGHDLTLKIIEDYGNDGYYNLNLLIDSIL